MPVRAAALPARRFAPALREEREVFREEVERRAAALGLQPLRWPEPFPFDSALRDAAPRPTRSRSGARCAFSLAAFRQAFAGGRDLDEPDNVLIAAAACEMHPAAVIAGAELRSVAEQLAERRERAAAADASVRDRRRRRPSFEGERAIEHASSTLGGRRAMKAKRAYRLIVTRGGRAPALLADPERIDHIEVVEIDNGEVVLFWDLPAAAPARSSRARCARTSPSWTPRSSSPRSELRRGSVPAMADAGSPRSTRAPCPSPTSRASGSQTMMLIRRFEERAGEMYAQGQGRRLPAPRRSARRRRSSARRARCATATT